MLKKYKHLLLMSTVPSLVLIWVLFQIIGN